MTYCHSCKKEFSPFGIARHRASHRDKKEDCFIEYSDGKKVQHLFSKKRKKLK
jgi:hypothetical protein